MTATGGQAAGVSRWDRLWRILPLPLLAVATAAALADAVTPPRDRLVTLALAAALAAWHWWLILAHPEWPERRLAPMAVYYAGLLALTWLLGRRDPAFMLVLLACLPMAFVALPGRYAYAGVVCGTVVTAGGPARLLDRTTLLLAVGAIAVAGFLGWAIRAMEAEAARRRTANIALAEANARLAELAEANGELQAQLLAGARATGVAGERARMARELHDTLAQGLAGIVTQLEAATAVADQPDKVRRRLHVARDLARESLAEARRAMDALRPGPLDATRLPEALSDLVRDWAARHDVPATMTTTGTARLLHLEVEITLLRAVQEGLANVARHAGASRADVTLSYMEDVVVADVRDDGAGFDAAAGSGGFGLTAMGQRARRLAGSVGVESAPGQGTAVSVTVPAIPPAGTLPGEAGAS